MKTCRNHGNRATHRTTSKKSNQEYFCPQCLPDNASVVGIAKLPQPKEEKKEVETDQGEEPLNLLEEETPSDE